MRHQGHVARDRRVEIIGHAIEIPCVEQLFFGRDRSVDLGRLAVVRHFLGCNDLAICILKQHDPFVAELGSQLNVLSDRSGEVKTLERTIGQRLIPSHKGNEAIRDTGSHRFGAGLPIPNVLNLVFLVVHHEGDGMDTGSVDLLLHGSVGGISVFAVD